VKKTVGSSVIMRSVYFIILEKVTMFFQLEPGN